MPTMSELVNANDPNFVWGEFVVAGGNSSVAAQQWDELLANPNYQTNIQNLVRWVLQPMRYDLGCPLDITSGLRSPSHNAEVGGVVSSLHLIGAAADLTSQCASISEVATVAQKYRAYLQEIEIAPDHVHVGLASQFIVGSVSQMTSGGLTTIAPSQTIVRLGAIAGAVVAIASLAKTVR